MAKLESSVTALLEQRAPVVSATYVRLLQALRRFGPVDEEPIP
jgi:hypothetical protein